MKLLFVLLLFSVSVYSQNLILNPGFENGLNHWYTDTNSSTESFFIDNEVYYSGTAALRVDNEAGDTAAWGQLLSVNAGSTYNIGYQIKSDNLETFMICFLEYKNDDETIFNAFMAPEGNFDDWDYRFGRIIIPEGVNQLIVLFVFFNGGTAWIDDVYLTQENQTNYSEFTVNLSQEQGSFKNLFQSNGIGPGYGVSSPLALSFQDLGIDYIRTHDFAIAFDHSTIVGLADDSYDQFDPDSYHFHISDSIAQNIYNAGGKIFYRFGQSYHSDPLFSSPPTNPQKWADVCMQILKHYNDGWNNGYNYDIDYVEIWNEPDLHEFWSGTVQDYIELYRIAATTIKNYNPDLKIGGPAIANPMNMGFIHEFLDSVSTHNLPLDFFSYHMYYLPNPYQYKLINDYLRQVLDNYGLHDTELVNTEWNTGIFNPNEFYEFSLDDAQNAANLVSVFHYMQDTDIGLFFRYALRNYWFGMVDDNGNLRYPGLAYKAFRELCQNSIRISAQGSDNIGKTISAAKTENEIQILVADNASTAQGYNIYFNDLLPQTEYNYTIYRICEEYHYQETEQGSFSESNPEISVEVSAPFTDHIKINFITSESSYSNHAESFIYPNPINDCFFICPKISAYSCEIYNHAGQLISTKTINDNKVSVVELSSGVYFVVVQTNNGKFRQKLVIE
jgi:xylan 1,4-beta-xylosidase